MYILEKQYHMTGVGYVWKNVYSSDDITNIKLKLTDMVRKGIPESDLRIVVEIPFELKMAVKIDELKHA